MIAELHGFLAAYARCIDDDRLEQWPEFFEERCLYRITTADNHRRGLEGGLVWADSRGMLTDRVSALREANIYERHTYRHILGLPHAEPQPDGTLRSETPFLVVRTMRDGSQSVFATGRYLDVLARVDGALKLRERLVVCDSSRTDTLLAIPL